MKGGGLQNLHPFSFCKSRKRLLDKTWDHEQNCVYDKVLCCTKRITGRNYEAPGNVFLLTYYRQILTELKIRIQNYISNG